MSDRRGSNNNGRSDLTRDDSEVRSTNEKPIAGGVSESQGFFAQLLEDWRHNGRDWTRPGFQALTVHRFGTWRMKIKPKVVRAPFSIAYRLLFRGMRNFYGIELPYSAKIGRRVTIEHQSGIVIHGNSRIGDGCIIRHGVTLGLRTLDHPFDAPTLGHKVNVGAGAKILGGVTIGDGAEIGANAVVRCDVPAGAVAVGVPARILPAAKPHDELAEARDEASLATGKRSGRGHTP